MTRNNKHKDLCVMGDFNCVENNIDRSPPHKDNEKVVASLRKVTTRNKLIDVWRMQNPMSKSFSFFQSNPYKKSQNPEAMGRTHKLNGKKSKKTSKKTPSK